MYNNGICTQQAGLYDAWAWLLETQGNYKAAESVYLKVTLTLMPQPLSKSPSCEIIKFPV